MARKPTLLCVDDDAQCLNVRRVVFEAFGFEVTCTTDPRQGLRLHASRRFDAALLDYQMPYLNGAELAKSMKVARPDVPVVILSGLPELPSGAPEYHDRFFCKTESGMKVAQAIQELIGQTRDKGDNLPVRKRLIAAAGVFWGFATQGVSDMRRRLFHGPALSTAL
ncbi:MAG TPA: response regulator [Terriglobales bacterium]|nr:response regulator [Terriglobales bacterium]